MTGKDHYAPDLEGVDKACSSCGEAVTFVRGDVRWCSKCGSLHCDAIAASVCFPSAVGIAFAVLEAKSEMDAAADPDSRKHEGT
jgi:ribosomal protein S27AE